MDLSDNCHASAALPEGKEHKITSGYETERTTGIGLDDMEKGKLLNLTGT
jgi:hypothetical protein